MMNLDQNNSKVIWRKLKTDKHIKSWQEADGAICVWEINNDERAAPILLNLLNLAGKLGIIDRGKLRYKPSSEPYVRKAEIRLKCKPVTVRTQPISLSSSDQ